MDYLRPKHQDIAIKGLDELRGKLPVPQQDVLEKLKEEDVPFPRMFRKAQEYSSRNLPTATIIWEYILGNANNKQQKFAVMNKLFQVQIATGPWKVAFETAHELFNETIAEYSFDSSSRQATSEEAFDTLVTSPLLFNACLNLGLIHRLLKELNKAEQFYKKAREIAATSKDFDKETVAKIHLATCLLDRGELKEAIETYFKPLMVFKTAMTTHTRALYLQHYGNACRSAADWGRAKEYLREALDLAKELKDIGLVSTCCGDLGNVFRSEGRYQDAERLHTVHHNLALSRGDIHGLAISCGNIGFLKFYNPEEFDDSVKLQFIEYSLSEEVGDFARMGIAFNKIGKLYTKLGYNEEAAEMFQIALDGARRAGNIAGEGMAWGNLGTVYRALEKFEDAITCHIKYRDNAERRMDTGGVAIMQHQLAMDYFLSGKLPEAERSILDAFETLEKIRSQIGEEDKSKLSNFEKNQADAYNLLQVVLVAQMKYKEALVLADSNRGRALAEIVRKRLLGCNSSGAEDVTLNEEYTAESFNNLLDVARKLSTTLVFYSVVKEFDESAAFYSWVYAWVLHPSGQLNFSKSRLQHGIRQTKVEVNDEFVLSLRRSMAQPSHTEDLGKILRCEKHLNISREAKGHAVTLQSEGVLNSLQEFQHMFSPYLSEANTENEKNLIHSGANIPYKTKDKELYHRPNFESNAYNPETDTQSNIENGNGETKEAAINDPKILSTSHAQSKPPFSTLKKISVEGECPEPDRKTVSNSEQALETTETQPEPPPTVCPSEAYAAEIQIEIEENSISEEDKSFEDLTYQLTTRPLNETTGHPSATSESSVNSVQNNKETSRVKTEAFCESLRQSEEEGQTAALDAISVNPDESLQVSEYDEETSEEIEMEKSEISEENKSLEDSTDDAVNVTTTGHPSATNASSVNSVQNNEETSGVKTETCCESLRQNKVEDQQTAALNAISVNPDEYLKIFEYQEETFEDLEGAETSLTKANSEGCDTPTLNEIYTEVEKDSVTTNCDTESALPDSSSDVMNEAPGTHSKQETVNNETSSTQQQNGNHIEKDVSVPGNDDVSEGTPPGPSNDVMTEPSGTIPKQHDKHESDPELDPWLPMLSQLHKVLIEPIVEYLPRKDENPRVTFIPQDFLLKVPFAALQSNAGDHYIMQDFVISTSPAIHFLELACASRTNAEQATAPQELSLLGVGNPIMPFEDLPQLPSAQREVRMISEIINSPKSEVLVGSRAKKKDVITAMPKHKILHFATHAIIDDTDSHGDFSMKGLIVLAKSGLECNGILTAEEVRRMELKAELVVLSCCDTGLGKVTGDGVLGLSRAFLAAGAACVIVTLWKIDDRSASELMTSFYREYRASRDAAVSLQRAMKILQAKEDTRSPQHWAAFSIVGATINSQTPKLET